MIRKIIYNLFLLLIFPLILFIIVLSTIGIETDKFNKFNINKILQSKNINLQLQTINFKLDLKNLVYLLKLKIQLLLNWSSDTCTKCKSIYRFFTFIKNRFKNKKINISLDELNYSQLNEISKLIKPSNFKNFLNNKIKSIKLITEIEFFLMMENLENYIS